MWWGGSENFGEIEARIFYSKCKYSTSELRCNNRIYSYGNTKGGLILIIPEAISARQPLNNMLPE